jgi:hypothetical protein
MVSIPNPYTTTHDTSKLIIPTHYHQDDDNIGGSGFPAFELGAFSAKKLLFTLLGLGGTYIAWLHRESILSFVQQLLSGAGLGGLGGGGKGYGRKLGSLPSESSSIRSRIGVINAVEVDKPEEAETSSEEIDQQMSDAARMLREAREARLRRFESMNQQHSQPQEEGVEDDVSSSDVG